MEDSILQLKDSEPFEYYNNPYNINNYQEFAYSDAPANVLAFYESNGMLRYNRKDDFDTVYNNLVEDTVSIKDTFNCANEYIKESKEMFDRLTGCIYCSFIK